MTQSKYDLTIEEVHHELKFASDLATGKGTSQERLASALIFLEPMRWKSVEVDGPFKGLLEDLINSLTGIRWEDRGTGKEKRDLAPISDGTAEWYWNKIQDLLMKVSAQIEARAKASGLEK